MTADLLRLMTWLSPAFPVGSFAYSHGLEQAIHAGLIKDRATLVGWLAALLERGSAWNDAVLLAEAWRVTAMQSPLTGPSGHLSPAVAGERSGASPADGTSTADDGAPLPRAGGEVARRAGEGVIAGQLSDLAALASAMAGSRERHMETTLQGAAFADAVQAWSGNSEPPAELPYPIAVALAAASHNIPLADTLTAYLHAFTSNLTQAAVRLVPLGQRDGVRTMAELEPVILAVSARAADSSLDDLGSSTVMSDILSMQHETLYSRVFRS